MRRREFFGLAAGLEYAEGFHYVGPAAAAIGGTESGVDRYVRENAVPVK